MSELSWNDVFLLERVGEKLRTIEKQAYTNWIDAIFDDYRKLPGMKNRSNQMIFQRMVTLRKGSRVDKPTRPEPIERGGLLG